MSAAVWIVGGLALYAMVTALAGAWIVYLFNRGRQR